MAASKAARIIQRGENIGAYGGWYGQGLLEEQNTEIFRHVLGGYGLFGVILDAWIRPVPNRILRSTSREVKTDDFYNAWKNITEEGAELAYGRLSVAPSSFFKTVWLSSYVSEGNEVAENPAPMSLMERRDYLGLFFVRL